MLDFHVATNIGISISPGTVAINKLEYQCPSSLSPWERQGRASCPLRHIRFPNADPRPEVSTGSDSHTRIHTVNHLCIYNSLGPSGEAYLTDLPSYFISTSLFLRGIV